MDSREEMYDNMMKSLEPQLEAQRRAEEEMVNITRVLQPHADLIAGVMEALTSSGIAEATDRAREYAESLLDMRAVREKFSQAYTIQPPITLAQGVTARPQYQPPVDTKKLSKEITSGILSGLKKKIKPKSRYVTLYLDRDHDLFANPSKRGRVLSFPEGEQRLMIFERLIGSGFVQTEEIKVAAKSNSANSVRKIIHCTNDLAKKNLGLKHNLIEGRRNPGYRIDLRYRVEKI